MRLFYLQVGTVCVFRIIVLLRALLLCRGESLPGSVFCCVLRGLLPPPHGESSSYDKSQSAAASIYNTTLDKIWIAVRCHNLSALQAGIVFVFRRIWFSLFAFFCLFAASLFLHKIAHVVFFFFHLLPASLAFKKNPNRPQHQSTTQPLARSG